ncbi:hypothetical protein [Marinimicrobium sp. C2-29]|uniref:hypothetical protein n=1 Tax=Marinimicrobium sp. C2-29 TaxID=3139825 RepID=UPI0031393E67
MQRLIYLIIGVIGGVLVGFISFTIYFEALLQHEKMGLAERFRDVMPMGYAADVNNSALASARIAFESSDYDNAVLVIGNELSVASNAIKHGAPQREYFLTISMLGACLAKSNDDRERKASFEDVALKFCASLAATKICETADLYNFIRTYTKSEKC